MGRSDTEEPAESGPFSGSSIVIDQRVGAEIAGYIIEDAIGRGGMGVVYRATRLKDSQRVALKLMLPELAANIDFRDRFMDEAEVTPFIDHPNIVPIYESGEADGELFIAMKLIDGMDMKRLIRQETRLTPRRAMDLLGQTASALDAAHEHGIVHRDVKPQNIMVSKRLEQTEQVFLTDFGLIRPVGSESTASRTGQIFGSIQYMSPEQIEGSGDDGRGDVYSLACVAYECLTGVIPFERPNEVGVIWAHIHDDPPRVTDVVSNLPGGLNSVIRQGMAKHPDDRFLTCGEFIVALREGLKRKSRDLVTRPLRPLIARIPRAKTEREVWAPNFFPELSRVRAASNKVNWFQTAAVFALLAVVAASVTQVAHPQGVIGAAGDVKDIVGDAAATVADVLPGNQDPDLAAPDTNPGRSVDLPAISSGDREALFGPRDLPPDARGSSSDSQRGTGPPVELPPDLATTKIAFGTNRHAGGAPAGEIYLMNADGTNLERLTDNDPAFDDWGPAISPNGEEIAFVSNRSGNYDVHVMDIDGTNVRRFTTTPDLCEIQPRWSPDGSKILYGDSCDLSVVGDADVWVIHADGSGAKNLTSSPDIDESSADWSPDGSKIVFDRDGDVYTMSSNGGDVRVLSSGPDSDYSPVWCRGGNVVVSSHIGSIDGQTDVIKIDTKTGVRHRLTFGEERDQFPTCAPDGTKITFLSRRDGHMQIYVMNSDGSEQVNLSRNAFSEYDPSWQLNF